MKKLFALLMALSLLMASGCGSKDTTPSTDETGDGAVVEETQGGEGQEAGDEAAADELTITGTLGEIKDFMFELKDEKGTTYALSFEGEKPEGLADMETGDKVTVTYTGELSVVDPFVGTIVSVEAAE